MSPLFLSFAWVSIKVINTYHCGHVNQNQKPSLALLVCDNMKGLSMYKIVSHSPFQGSFTLNIELLGQCATKCRAYAKALHYKEEEFITKEATTDTLESLIRLQSS